MILTQLSNKIAKELEHNSVRIEGLIHHGTLDSDTLFKKIIRIQGWYHNNGLDANDSVHKKIAKVSELLGFQPNYHVIYVHRNAVWGLNWKGQEFVIYYDKRGISVQVKDGFPEDLFYSFLDELGDQLNATDFLTTKTCP